jgi:S-formylglutathione hydrolase FrmB
MCGRVDMLLKGLITWTLTTTPATSWNTASRLTRGYSGAFIRHPHIPKKSNSAARLRRSATGSYMAGSAMFDTLQLSPVGLLHDVDVPITNEVNVKTASMLLRVLCAAALAGSLTVSTPSRGIAANYENLMVPSAAMGRDIPVTFLGGGPHAIYLLDAFNAAPDVSNWVTAGNVLNTLAGKGISAVAPAGGAFSMYTNWEQDSGKQWDTFLSTELPDWLAANKGLSPGGHAVVGASQGGYAAAALATFHPDRFRYAGSLSGFLAPERTGVDGAITAGLKQGGADSDRMWGAPQLGRWKWHSPNQNVQQLADNSTRLWVYCPRSGAPSDQAAMIGQPDIATGTNATFYALYRGAGGTNGHFDLGRDGNNDWPTWGQQLSAMSGDLAAHIR